MLNKEEGVSAESADDTTHYRAERNIDSHFHISSQLYFLIFNEMNSVRFERIYVSDVTQIIRCNSLNDSVNSFSFLTSWM